MFTILLLVFTVLIIYFYLNELKERRNGPPGLPFPLPIFGNLLNLALASDVPHLAMSKLSKRYEDIFRIKLGHKNLCIINSIEAIQTLFTNDDTSGRDLVGTIFDRNFGKSLGIAFSEGPSHQQLKIWTVRNLRDYGFGKSSSMERIINQELTGILKEIEKAIDCKRGIMDIEHSFILSVFKVAWQMIKGPVTPEDEIMIKRLLFKSEAMISKGTFGAGIANAFPFLKFIFPNLTGHNIQMDFYNDCHQTAKELLNASKNELKYKESAENFIESYAQKMEEESNHPQTMFTTEQFMVLFMDLLQASSDTTSSFLETCILYSVLHPDVQSEIYGEIQRCIPQDKDVEFADKKGMIYTQAFFLETHRHARTVQNLIPHKCLRDVKYKDFVLKKGTVLLADLYTANADPKIWNKPESFLPERFINENEQLINQNKIIPFGNGPRACPGELLANATYFLIYVNILKKYRLSQVPRQIPPRADLNVTFTSKPFPFQVLFSKRT